MARHRNVGILAAGTSLLLSALTVMEDATAAVVTYRADGAVVSLQGDISLLPVTAPPGTPFSMLFSFDTTTPDLNANPAFGNYAITDMTVTVGTTSIIFAGPGTGEGRIAIQATGGANQLWGVLGCLPTCSGNGSDEARMNLFFTLPGSVPTDALTLPPSFSGAFVQFGLFSPGQPNGFLNAQLTSLTPVPLPAAAWLLLSGLGGVGALKRRRRTGHQAMTTQ